MPANFNPNTPRKPTINDVAREADVGKTSVSRYLNVEFDSLSEALRLRIQQAISTLSSSAKGHPR